MEGQAGVFGGLGWLGRTVGIGKGREEWRGGGGGGAERGGVAVCGGGVDEGEYQAVSAGGWAFVSGRRLGRKSRS